MESVSVSVERPIYNHKQCLRGHAPKYNEVQNPVHVQYESKKSFRFCNTEWKGRSIPFHENGKRNGRAVPFRFHSILRSVSRLP